MRREGKWSFSKFWLFHAGHNTSSHDAKDINRSHAMDVKGTGYRLALTNSEGFYDKWGIGNHLADGSW